MGRRMARAITKVGYKVLELLKNNQKGYMTPSEICYALNKKSSSVSNLLSRLKRKGLIELQQLGLIHNYTLTNKGKELLNRYLKRVIAQAEQPNLNTEALYTRLHALALSIPLKNKLDQQQRAELVAQHSPRALNLKNHLDYIFIFEDYTFKLTSSSLIAYAKQSVAKLDEPIPQLTQQAIQDTLNVIYALEMQLNAKNGSFKLKRITKTINNQKDYTYSLIELHIAITNDLFAREATKISDPYIIAMSEVDAKKVGMLSDKSIKLGSGYDQQGIPEVEGISHATLKDGKVEAVKNMENIRKLYEMVGKGEFNPQQEQNLLRQLGARLKESTDVIAKLAQSQLTQSEHLNYYAEQIEAHSKAIVKLNKVLDKLDRLLSQRTLRD